MKLIEKADATGTLAEYAANIQSGPLIVTVQGSPVAALVAIENADLETVALSTNQQFLNLIERSRLRVREEGGVSGQEMRRKFQTTPPQNVDPPQALEPAAEADKTESSSPQAQ